jgi:GMP synthase-like glutamine amidotransferase
MNLNLYTTISKLNNNMKKEKFKFYASATSKSHGNWLQPLGFEPTDNLTNADLIVFGGGADIDPNTYGEKPGSSTYASPQREKQEKEDYNRALKLGIKMYGTCRGLQFLCAMAGGKLIQDVTNHQGDHSMTTYDGVKIRTNSIHHQMINPYVLDSKNYRILAWTSTRISRRYFGAKDKSVYLPYEFKEIEAAYFPKINAMGIQGHPEMMYGSAFYEPTIEWMQNTFLKFFNNEL